MLYYGRALRALQLFANRNGGTFGDDLFRNGISGEESTQSQQIGNNEIALLNTLEGKRPGSRYWIGILSSPKYRKSFNKQRKLEIIQLSLLVENNRTNASSSSYICA